MALRTVLKFPDPRLRHQAEPVKVFDQTLTELVNDMIETMIHDRGVGLAATQIGVDLRVLVTHCQPEEDAIVFINPIITEKEGKTIEYEGCLSVPEIFAKVERAKKITVQFQDLEGNAKQMHLDGLMAQCLQHEIDHLDGKLFVDHLSPLKVRLLRNKLKKLEREFDKTVKHSDVQRG